MFWIIFGVVVVVTGIVSILLALMSVFPDACPDCSREPKREKEKGEVGGIQITPEGGRNLRRELDACKDERMLPVNGFQ